MNVDSQIPQLPLAAYPARPVKSTAEQASARPVDRPHHSAAPNNRHQGEPPVQPEARKEAERPAVQGKTSRQESELSQGEKRELEKPGTRDHEVRAHEAAHKNVQTVRRAATAPAQPSSQDFAVSGEASRMEAEARSELSEQPTEKSYSSPSEPRRGFATNPTQPAPVGDLLDVIA